MFKLQLSEDAKFNLGEIQNYITNTQKEPENAKKVIEQFRLTFRAIQKNPKGYKVCPELEDRKLIYRQALCYNWLIIFKVEGNIIQVFTITSGKRLRTRLSRLKD